MAKKNAAKKMFDKLNEMDLEDPKWEIEKAQSDAEEPRKEVALSDK